MCGGSRLTPGRNPHRRPARPRWTRFRFSVGAGHLTRCTSLFLEWSVVSYSGFTGTLFLCPLQRLGGRQGMEARASGPLRARVGPGWEGSWWFGFPPVPPRARSTAGFHPHLLSDEPGYPCVPGPSSPVLATWTLHAVCPHPP